MTYYLDDISVMQNYLYLTTYNINIYRNSNQVKFFRFLADCYYSYFSYLNSFISIVVKTLWRNNLLKESKNNFKIFILLILNV